MSALAQLLLRLGHSVTASDRFWDQGMLLPTMESLQSQGVQFFPQDGSAIHKKLDAYVLSTAVEEDNVEYQKALALNVPVLHRAALLAEQVVEKKLIAIAGTSGKTTTTGMLAWVLEALGWDINVVNGGALLNWQAREGLASVRVGDSPYWVLEADESDRSFLRFSPDFAIISNITPDHFDEAETIALFKQFASQVKEVLLVGAGVKEVLLAGEHEITAEVIEVDAISFPKLPMPGAHNQFNAASVFTLCKVLGFDAEKIKEALNLFKGIERRFEYVGSFQGAEVYDDYAHNPDKIEAAWRTARSRSERVVVVWRPHGFKPLRMMFGRFKEIFGSLLSESSDELILLPVYYAGGTVEKGLDSEDLLEVLKSEGATRVRLCTDYESLRKYLEATVAAGEVLLFTGARDPELPAFARALNE